MIFQFDAENATAAKAALRFCRLIDRGRLSVFGDPKTTEAFASIIRLPPHMPALEDMTFFQDTVQRLWEGYYGHAPATASLVPSIDIDDRNGCRVYWIPSAKGSNRCLVF